jgi:shikimate kinase
MTKKIISRDLEKIRNKLASDSIVLVGLMGAGKTTIGRRLAKKLRLPFVDADHEIEKAAGMSVADIFEQHGEAHFRDGERKVIARMLESGPQVLATGGGAYMDDTTRANIAGKGVCVWLKCEHKLLMTRVRKRAGRPLLKADDPEAVMQKLIDERYPVYGKADLCVASRDVPHAVIVNDVIRALRDYFDDEQE